MNNLKNLGKTVISFSFFLVLTVSASNTVFGQAQSFEFSGNDVNSYQCFDEDGESFTPPGERDGQGRFLCCSNGSSPIGGFCGGAINSVNGNTCVDADGNPGSLGDPGCPASLAVLRPPALQQLEIWFVRLIYVVWSLTALLSVFFLFALGYQYILTRGDVTKITEIRQKIIYYFIGFVLVFLAVPILSTVFRLLGINDEVQCYNVDLPAFQFFYSDLCTAPNIESFCSNPNGLSNGLACSPPGETVRCSGFSFVCSLNTNVWEFRP